MSITFPITRKRQKPAKVSRDVERGVALLDEKRPGWENEIDLTNLRMASFQSCILGQLYKSHIFPYTGYFEGCNDLGISGADGSEYGFDLPEKFKGKETSWEQLDQEWRDLIIERRMDQK